MATFKKRIIGALKLDVAIYEEVESDPRALNQSMAVVILSSLAAGIGAGSQGIATVANLFAALIMWF